jgi:hypothetical protein
VRQRRRAGLPAIIDGGKTMRVGEKFFANQTLQKS